MRRGASLTQTVSLNIVPKADISTVTFTDPTVYSKQTAKRQKAITDTINYAKVSGLDKAGAEKAELASVFQTQLLDSQCDI